MAAMNRGLNLPSIQRIMNEFEKESATLDMKGEIMSDAVDDVMDDEAEDEEEEGDKILKEVLDEIGVDLSQKLTEAPSGSLTTPLTNARQAVAVGGEMEGPTPFSKSAGDDKAAPSGAGLSDEDALQARLDALRRG